MFRKKVLTYGIKTNLMSNVIHIECRNCDRIAETFPQIERIFGWMTIDGIRRAQVNCKKCRVKIQRDRIRAGLQSIR